MHQPEKDDSSKQSKAKPNLDVAMIGDLAKNIAEVLQEESVSIEESFESYVHQLRMRLCRDVQTFQTRFIQGYEILLEQLRSTP